MYWTLSTVIAFFKSVKCQINCLDLEMRDLCVNMRVSKTLMHKGTAWALPQFSNFYIYAIQCVRPMIFHTINSVRSIIQGLKYYRFTPSSCKDIGIIKF